MAGTSVSWENNANRRSGFPLKPSLTKSCHDKTMWRPKLWNRGPKCEQTVCIGHAKWSNETKIEVSSKCIHNKLEERSEVRNISMWWNEELISQTIRSKFYNETNKRSNTTVKREWNKRGRMSQSWARWSRGIFFAILFWKADRLVIDKRVRSIESCQLFTTSWPTYQQTNHQTDCRTHQWTNQQTMQN